jgi:protein-S-isoprenylcysteine O-methyltransferase Ste14
MNAPIPRTEWTGRVLVALQFGLLTLLGWRACTPPVSVEVPVIGLLAGSASLAFWALTANRPGNFNIRPTPRHGGVLVTSGPYRWIRHPMYTAVLMAAAAAAAQSRERADVMLWFALAGVLLVKAGFEEEALLRQFPDYRDYKARTMNFLPWLG